MRQHIDTLMQKEMTRKEFMATLGFGFLSMMGLSTIIRLLTGTSPDAHLNRHFGRVEHGYGGGTYGGGKDSL